MMLGEHQNRWREVVTVAQKIGDQLGEAAALDALHEHGHYLFTNEEPEAWQPARHEWVAKILAELPARDAVSMTAADWDEAVWEGEDAFRSVWSHRQCQAEDSMDCRPLGYGD